MQLKNRFPLWIALLSFWGFMAFAWAPGLQADDLTHVILLKRPLDGHSASWAWVWEDFFTPWLGSENWPYYRPLSTLLYVSWIKTFGLYSAYLGLLGILLHSLNLFLFDGFLRTLHPRPFVETLVLLFVGLSPIAFEPVTWWSSSTDLFQFTFVLLSLLFLSRHRQSSPPKPRYFWTSLFLFLGLLTKESALIFFPLLLLYEFIGERKKGKGFPFRLLGTLTLGLLLYGALRWNAVGLSPVSQLESPPWTLGKVLAALPFKIEATLSPLFALPLPHAMTLALTLFSLALLLASLRQRKKLAGVLIFLALVLPSLFHPVTRDLSGSRVLYSAIFGSGLLYLLLLLKEKGEKRLDSWTRWGGTALLLLSLPAAVWVDFDLAQRRQEALELATSVRGELRALARKTPPQRPLALLSFPTTYKGIPIHLPNRNFILTQSALLKKPNPVLDLECLFEPVYGSLKFLYDATPLRALSETGANFVFYQQSLGKRKKKHLLLRPSPKPQGKPRWSTWTQNEKGLFRPPQSLLAQHPAGNPGVSPEAIEEVRVRFPKSSSFSPFFLRWKPVHGPWSKRQALKLREDSSAILPLDASLPFYSTLTLGGIEAWKIETSTGPFLPPPGLELSTLNRLPFIETTNFFGKSNPSPISLSMTLGDLIHQMEVPKGINKQGKLTLTLLTAGGAFQVFAEKGTWNWNSFIRNELSFLLKIDPSQACIFYLTLYHSKNSIRARSKPILFHLVREG